MTIDRKRLAWCALAAIGVLPVAAGAQVSAPPGSELLARGEYLARIGGCASCHTMQRDGIPFAGGRALSTPLGPIISTNITPDPKQGIGRYTFADFERVMREGTAPGSRHLYPAMAYTAYTKATDEDLRALFAYLMHAVPASDYAPPATKMPFPFNQRWALRFWKAAFLSRGTYTENPGRDAEWNRGAYLVQSFGHCGSCHTPRGMAYQERGYDESAKRFLTGMVNDNWYASNLTGDRGAGLGRTDARSIASFLRTGYADGRFAFGSMAEEVEKSLQHLTPADAKAIAGYLKSLPARRNEGGYTASDESARTLAQGNHTLDVESTGAGVYRSFCAQCHHPDGKGVAGVFPRLAGNPTLLSEDPTSIVRVVIQGGTSAATATGPALQAMPGFASTLTDVQMAQALTYIRQAWGNDAAPVKTGDVTKLRAALKN
ncbi:MULTISPECIES: cytochrome c [unclassified Variovorax]|uniref:cytochrome c n=1 Tax=unclassified Variovorax TaxID=663243 RepID=UPI0008BCE39F|nr:MULTISPECIES: cytochrome c [unclassified Variovorax]SEK17121.1 Cytochrome c, mono-and diheme variants [Variovorax sp. OK202]SFE72821.1 Cytochrome c, mono-and diheme variants [Variovorax sp. OK212]